jgi:hypothetical protein
VVGAAWRSPTKPRLARSLLVASALLWVLADINAVMDARVQLAVDRANTALVDFLARLPTRSRVVLNMTPVNEYHFELPMHLSEIARRPDIVVEPLAAAPRAPSPADVFVVTPEMENQPGPTVRIAAHEPRVRHDNATLATLLTSGADLVYRTAQHTRLVEVGIHRLLCPLAVSPFIDATYCPRDRGVIYRPTFSYGWQVHRLRPVPARSASRT